MSIETSNGSIDASNGSIGASKRSIEASNGMMETSKGVDRCIEWDNRGLLGSIRATCWSIC